MAIIDGTAIHVVDDKATGTDAGTFTSGAWQTRVLNATRKNDIVGASLAANQITLPAGDYYFRAMAPVYHGLASLATSQLRLRNITDGTTTAFGGNNTVGSATVGQAGMDHCRGFFTLGGIKVMELQHRTSVTKTTDGLGHAANFDENEVYADIIIFQVT